MKRLAVLRRPDHELDDDGDACLASCTAPVFLSVSANRNPDATCSGLKTAQMPNAPSHLFELMASR
jgi:hypothetical protein